MLNDRPEQGIEMVIQQCADLLKTRVWAIDRQGTIIAGSEAAAQGLPLADVADASVTRLRVPMSLDGQRSITIIAETASDDATPLHLAQALVELIVNQVTVINQLPNQRQLERRFVYSLLFEPVSDEATVLRHGASIGVDLTIPRAVLLIDASRYILGVDRASSHPSDHASDHTTERIADEGLPQKRAEGVIALIAEYFHLPRATICTYIGNGEIVVLKASTTKDLSAWTSREEGEGLPIASWANLAALKRAARGLLSQLRAGIHAPVTIGIGRYYPGIDGLPRSYQDARAALTLGCRSLGPNRVHCLDALGIAAFVGVSDARTKIDLATHLLSPLDHEDELLQTLRAFFEQDCCISATANSLGIHRNTLTYRLEKVASLTGLDPHRFDDAVQIRLALELRSLESVPADYADAQYLTVKHA